MYAGEETAVSGGRTRKIKTTVNSRIRYVFFIVFVIL